MTDWSHGRLHAVLDDHRVNQTNHGFLLICWHSASALNRSISLIVPVLEDGDVLELYGRKLLDNRKRSFNRALASGADLIL